MCAGIVPGGPLARRNCTPPSTCAASRNIRVTANKAAETDDQPAAALPSMVLNNAANATTYDITWAIHESRFSPCRSWGRLPSHEAMARRQTTTWMTQMASISTAETSAPSAQANPGAAAANDGNITTAAAAAMTEIAAQPAAIWVSRRWRAIRAAMAGCAVAPYSAACLAGSSSSLIEAA